MHQKLLSKLSKILIPSSKFAQEINDQHKKGLTLDGLKGKDMFTSVGFPLHKTQQIWATLLPQLLHQEAG